MHHIFNTGQTVRFRLADYIIEASHQWAENMEAGNWDVAGWWAHRAFHFKGILDRLDAP